MITDHGKTSKIDRPSVIRFAAALGLVVLSVLACAKTDNSISEELLGVWVADQPQYRGRFLQISRDTITFGQGAGEVATYAISSIESEKSADSVLICVHYRDLSQNEYQVSFYHDEAADGQGRLWMKHQKDIIWRREAKEPLHELHYR